MKRRNPTLLRDYRRPTTRLGMALNWLTRVTAETAIWRYHAVDPALFSRNDAASDAADPADLDDLGDDWGDGPDPDPAPEFPPGLALDDIPVDDIAVDEWSLESAATREPVACN